MKKFVKEHHKFIGALVFLVELILLFLWSNWTDFSNFWEVLGIFALIWSLCVSVTKAIEDSGWSSSLFFKEVFLISVL